LIYFYERKILHECGLHDQTHGSHPDLPVYAFSLMSGTDTDNETPAVVLMGYTQQLGRKTLLVLKHQAEI